MNSKILNKKTIIFIFLFFLIICLENTSMANISGSKMFNNAPRMVIKTNPNKIDDIDITIIDYNGLDSSKIKFYSMEGKTKTEIKDKDFIKKITHIH